MLTDCLRRLVGRSVDESRVWSASRVCEALGARVFDSCLRQPGPKRVYKHVNRRLGLLTSHLARLWPRAPPNRDPWVHGDGLGVG